LLPLRFWNPNNHIPQNFRLATKPMPRLRQGFAIQQILLVKINFGQIILTQLHFNATGRAGSIASAVIVQFKPEDAGRL
jgi:hypothetical protein